jgi:hypothetical protein
MLCAPLHDLGPWRHEWHPTGRIDVHAGGMVRDRPALLVEFVRCFHCRQDGLRYGNSSVVFTWGTR